MCSYECFLFFHGCVLFTMKTNKDAHYMVLNNPVKFIFVLICNNIIQACSAVNEHTKIKTLWSFIMFEM